MPTEKEISSAVGVRQAKKLAQKLVSLDKVPEYFVGKNKDGIKKFVAKHPTLKTDEPYEQDEVFTGSNKKKDMTTMNADLDLGADEYVYDVKETCSPAIKKILENIHHLGVGAHELVLHSDNDPKQYKSSKAPIEKNLTKKFKKGQYDHDLAHKLWMHHANRAAQAYHKEHGDKNLPWHHMFSVDDRKQAAHHWADSWHDEMKSGNMHESTDDLYDETLLEAGEPMSPAPATSDNPAPGGADSPTIGQNSQDDGESKEHNDEDESETSKDAKDHLEAIAMAAAEAYESVGGEEIPGWVLEKLKLAQDFVESALKHISDSAGEETDEDEEQPGKNEEPAPTTKPDANEGGKAAMAKEEKEHPSAGLSAKKKAAVVKKAKKGENIGHGGFARLAAKAAEKYGSKESGEKVAAAAMWKHLKR